ncbi:hypothetical protein P3T27_001344 [Kitasatospora sp. MAA19]|uniref:hypothetical protein n=1 Tax=Kitasatospora sp. MAA19 TaxID=3035090 RepID=UPI002473CE7A|nr:hypothetical protein [Kitasatospora sp. MAA19]MDH6704641.1 hypothetical protein [Kitasatospora sp. MAA19]
MITQIVTLVGVLLGALTSFVATGWAERVKHRRLMATRWDERKLDTYVQYATCVKEIAAVAKRAVDAEAGSTARADLLAAMEQAEIQRSTLFETLVLLASPAAVEAAKAVNAALWESEIAARGHVGVPDGSALIELLNAYHSQARLDLGVGDPAVA